jgi:hypothetical protein
MGWWPSLSAGLIGGCAVLVRPVGVLYCVPLLICLFLALRRRALRPALIFTAAFLLFPLLWASRNYLRADYFGVSTVGPGDLFFYRASGTLAVRMPGDYQANALKVRGVFVAQTCEDLERAYGRDCSQVTDSQRTAYYKRKGTRIILNDLPGYFRSSALGLPYMLFGGGVDTLSRISNVKPATAKRLVLFITIPEACLAVIGCWYWFRRQRYLCYLLTFTVVYFFAISMAGIDAYSRYRVPVMPMYALLVGGGAAATIRSIPRLGRF